MIQLRDVSARAGQFRLEGISFNIDQGAFGVVVGPAGSGKSTMLEVIAGVTPSLPGAGRVVVNGRDITHLGIDERGIGIVFQHAYLFPHLDVLGNIRYGAQSESDVSGMVELFGLSDHVAKSVTALSGGERQLVALARALARRPGVLLLDEPFSALDPRRRAAARRALRDLHREWHFTALLVTHDYAEAGLLGDHLVLLDNGSVLQSGPPVEVFSKPKDHRVAELLGAENVLAGIVERERTAGDSGSGVVPVVFRVGTLEIHSVGDVSEGPGYAVVRAEEIVVSRSPVSSSARNNFQGVVAEVSTLVGHSRVAVDVEGVTLVALLTSHSVRELQIEVGSVVYLSFKAFAVHFC